jgi:hypothetical protein
MESNVLAAAAVGRLSFTRMRAVDLLFPPLLGALLTLAAAGVTAGSRGRRAFGVALGLAAMLPPWLLPSELPWARGGAALVAFAGTMRVVDLARGRWPLAERLRHVVSVVDSRRLVRARPRFDGAAFARALAWGALALAAAWLLRTSRDQEGAARWLWRWGAGLGLVYAAIECLYRVIVCAYGAMGLRTPPLHESPVLARSVQELWGERWARPISLWLGDTFFKPWARRRRPLLGVLLAFAVSAAFHAYAVWVALGVTVGLTMAAWMFAYFALQGLVMAIERVAGVRRWAPVAAHVWTVAWMVLLSPVFVEPAVRVLGLA